MKKCKKCGKELQDSDVFCSGCGSPLDDTSVTEGENNSTASIIESEDKKNNSKSISETQKKKVSPTQKKEKKYTTEALIAIVAVAMIILGLFSSYLGNGGNSTNDVNRDLSNTDVETGYVEETITNLSLYCDFTVSIPSDYASKSLSLVIDSEEVVEIPNREYFTYLTNVEEGTHTVEFMVDGVIDESYSNEIEVYENVCVKCDIGILDNEFYMTGFETSDSISDSAIEYPNLYNVSLTDALQTLSDKHFVYIDYVSNNDELILDTNDWVVETQNHSEGEYIDKTDTIELVCKKVYYQCYVDLTFDKNIVMAKYGLDMYLDDEKICNIPHGEVCTYLAKVKEGKHTLTFYKESDKSVYKSQEFEVSTDTTFKANLHTNDTTVEVNEYQLLNSIEGASIEVSDVYGMLLTDALKTLSDAGFINVTTQSNGSIWDKSGWTVTAQSVSAGSSVDKNTEIVLTCVKNVDYMTDVYLAKYVPEVEEIKDANHNKISYVKYTDGSDMNSDISTMSEDEKKLWYVVQATYLDDTIILRIGYTGTIEMVYVVGKTATEAENRLKQEGFSFITIESEDGSTIYNNDKWKITSQSVDAGTMHGGTSTIVLKAKKIETTSSSSSASSSSEKKESKYEFACEHDAGSYKIYYLIDTDEKRAVRFTTHETGRSWYTVSGSSSTGFVLTCDDDGSVEELYFFGGSVTHTDSSGNQTDFTRVSVEAAEKHL